MLTCNVDYQPLNVKALDAGRNVCVTSVDWISPSPWTGKSDGSLDEPFLYLVDYVTF